MKEQSTSRGFAILSLAGIMAKLMSVLYVPLLAAIIGTGGYGKYQQTYDVFIFLYAVLNLGMQPAIAKYVSELESVGNHRDALRTFRLARTIMVFIGTILTILMIVSSKYVASISSSPDIYIGIIALAPAMTLTSVLCAYRGYFQGKNLMTPLAVSQVLEQLLNIVVSLVCAFYLMRFGPEYGSAGGTIGTSIGAFVAIYYLIYIATSKLGKVENNTVTNNEIKWIRKETILRKLFAYGFPIALSAGLQNFGAVVDMINVKGRLLHAGFNPDERDVLYGILGYYKTLIYVPLTIITALGTAVIPAISKALVIRDKKDIKEKIIFAMRMAFLVAIPSTVGLAILSKEVYIVLFNKTLGHELMLYGSIVIIFMAIVQIQNTLLQSINQFYFVILSLLIGIILKITANYILVGYRDINVNGAVVGGILCFSIPMLLNHRKMCRTLKFKFSLLKLASKPIISSLIMGLVVYGAKLIVFGVTNKFLGSGRFATILPLAIVITIGAFVYTFMMAYTGGIRKKEVDAISPKLNRILPKVIKAQLR